MSSVFIGRMSNGEFRAAVAKSGFDAADPATKLADMKWSSDVATIRFVASGQTLVDGFNGVAGSGDGMGSTANVTIPEVVGTFYARCLVQAENRWSWVFYNLSTGVYSTSTNNDMATGWWMHPRGTPSGAGAWIGPNVELSLVNSTTLGIRTNNSGNGTNNKTRVRWAVFESR